MENFSSAWTIVAKNVCWRSRQFGPCAKVSARHFGTDAKLSGNFSTSQMVPKCLGPSGLGPKCLDTITALFIASNADAL